MKIIHVMKDGTVKKSIKGTVVRNKDFYQVLTSLRNKKGAKK